MSEFTQGICGNGAAILRDGIPVSIDEIVSLLNKSDTKLDSGDLHFGWRDAGPGNLFRMGFDAGLDSGVKAALGAVEEQDHGKDGIKQLLAAVDAVLNDAEEWRGAVVCSDSVAEALYDQGGAIVTEMRMRELAIARRGIGLEGRS